MTSSLNRPSPRVCLAYTLGLASPSLLEGGPDRDVWPAPSASGFSERSLLPVCINLSGLWAIALAKMAEARKLAAQRAR